MQGQEDVYLSKGLPNAGRLGGLDAIVQQLDRLQDAVEGLAADLTPVSRFDEPEAEMLTTVRDEPPSTLRLFEVRLSDLTDRLQRMRRQLDL
jgi:hypothetical protein